MLRDVKINDVDTFSVDIVIDPQKYYDNFTIHYKEHFAFALGCYFKTWFNNNNIQPLGVKFHWRRDISKFQLTSIFDSIEDATAFKLKFYE